MSTNGMMRIATDARAIGIRIFADYQRFVTRWEAAEEIGDDPADDAKRFAARHAAARTALAHLEHLCKIASLTGGEDAAEAVLHDLAAWRALMPVPSEEEPDADEPGRNG
jgi:hypothetical protein